MENENKYRICSNCIMDTKTPEITFDQKGVCCFCKSYYSMIDDFNKKTGDKKAALNKIVDKIKKDGKNKKYDCVLGISGGVDSAYMAYLGKSLGLRILAVHVDAGWNSETAVSNIKKICSALDIELHTIVVDWTIMKELQRAYMFSGLPNLDVPQDHAFYAAVYKYASKYRIKYMLNGGNYATESILPISYGYSATDYTNIKDVYKKCGRGKVSLRKYPHVNLLQHFIYSYILVKKVRLLNYIDYSKKDAIKLLNEKFGWEYYGGKHFESRFTKWFQGYYLIEKFGYEKKRAHLSSLVVGGEMTRDEALAEMADSSDYTSSQIEEDTEYILKKLEISRQEFDEILASENKNEDYYKTNKKALSILRKIKHSLWTTKV